MYLFLLFFSNKQENTPTFVAVKGEPPPRPKNMIINYFCLITGTYITIKERGIIPA
jgi:hypothetical protein